METIQQDDYESNKENLSKGQVDFWQIHENRISKAPEIISRKVLSPEDLAEREGVSLDKLETKIKERTEEFAEHCGKTCSFPDYKYWPLLEEMYSLYLASGSKEYSETQPWINGFASFDAFVQYFCPKTTEHAKVFMKYNIMSFLEKTIHPERVVRVNPDGRREFDPKNGFFESDGKWTVLPENEYGDVYNFAEESIIREIADLIQSGYREPDYSHATASSALKNIGKNGALLSSSEAKKEGVEISTGEFVSYHYDQPLEYRGLGSVYADRGGPRYGYQFFSWFDEYYISFGISKEKQDEFMRTTDFRYNLRGEGEEKLSADYGSEGVVIGHKVPLQSVKFIYCWKKYQEQTEEWKDKFCPNAKVVSYEAARTLSEFGNYVNAMSQQQQIKPEDAWIKLCETTTQAK